MKKIWNIKEHPFVWAWFLPQNHVNRNREEVRVIRLDKITSDRERQAYYVIIRPTGEISSECASRLGNHWKNWMVK